MEKGEMIRRCLPSELSSGDKAKFIEPPKGPISSKTAFELEQRIAEQLQPSITSPLIGHIGGGNQKKRRR